MSKVISLDIRADDHASAKLNKINQSVKSLGTAAKAGFALFAADAVVSFFKDAITAASEADSNIKDSMQGVSDTFVGFQIGIAKSITGNTKFMTSIENLLTAIGPLVEGLVSGLVPVLGGLAQAASFAANAISKYLGPVFQALKIVTVGAAIGVKSLYQAMNGDLVGAYNSLKSLEGISERLGNVFENIPEPTPSNYRESGRRARLKKDGTKATASAATKPSADEEFERLVKLRDQNALHAGELDDLTKREASYRLELDKTNLTTERRLKVLDLLKSAGEFTKKQAEDEQKSLDERVQGYKALEDAQRAQLDALVSLAEKGKATVEERTRLQRELEDARTAADYASNPVDRNKHLDDVERLEGVLRPAQDSIRGMIGMSAEEMSSFIADSFGNGLLAGFQTAFSAAASGNIFGAIRGFFAGLSGVMGNAISQLASETMTKLVKDFIGRQVKVFMGYGNIMKGLSKFLSNPWTAGFAAVAIGVALSGLSRSLGAQASGGAGSSPVFGTGFNNSTTIAANAGGTVNVYVDGGGIINLNDPNQRRSWQDLIRDSNGRNINIYTGR